MEQYDVSACILHLLLSGFSNSSTALLLKRCSVWGFCDTVLYCFPSLCCPHLVLQVFYKKRPMMTCSSGPLLTIPSLHPFGYFGLRNISHALLACFSFVQSSAFFLPFSNVMDVFLWLIPSTSSVDYCLFIPVTLIQKLNFFVFNTSFLVAFHYCNFSSLEFI